MLVQIIYSSSLIERTSDSRLARGAGRITLQISIRGDSYTSIVKSATLLFSWSLNKVHPFLGGLSSYRPLYGLSPGINEQRILDHRKLFAWVKKKDFILRTVPSTFVREHTSCASCKHKFKMDKCRPKLTTILLCKTMKDNAVNLRLVFQLIIFRRQEKGENK